MKPIRITSLNVRGLASKSPYFLSFLTDSSFGLNSPDILLLQETPLNSPSTPFLNSSLFGPHYTVFHAPASSRDPAAGVAIAVHNSSAISAVVLAAFDPYGRWIHVHAKIADIGLISLLCTYAPSSCSPNERA